jgi:Ser/Thr protein kinase RdoA (MazF antagonist)
LSATGNTAHPAGHAAHAAYAAYASLGPQQVLAALDAVGLRGDGRILQLNSYENRVFQVMLEDGGTHAAVVPKFYRPGRWSDAQIVEEHGFALELAAAEVPVVAPLTLHDAGIEPALVRHNAGNEPALVLQGTPPTLASLVVDGTPHRFAVAPRCAGREPPLDDPAVLQQLGRFIGRLHAVGAARPFQHRHRLNAPADAAAAIQLLLEGGHVTPAELPAWQAVAQEAVRGIEAAFAALPTLASLRLHGDCHPGNVLWRGEPGSGGPHVVDLDDAMQGPAVQDLWMLVSGDAASMRQQLFTLLEGYEQFREFDDRELALIEPLRTLRMLRHSAWLAARWADPSFPIHFPFFGSAAYWSEQTAQLREQVVLMRGC